MLVSLLWPVSVRAVRIMKVTINDLQSFNAWEA